MRKDKEDSRYARVGDYDKSNKVQAITYKVGSTSILKSLGRANRQWTALRPGDHVILYVRDPRDRLVSAWKWFTNNNTSYRKHIMEQSKRDHDFLLDKRSEFAPWVETALRYWDPHWVPQTEVHPRWRQFELRDLKTLGNGRSVIMKQTRPVGDDWRKYYDDSLLELVNEVYAEDLEMWKEVESGVDTTGRRVL